VIATGWATPTVDDRRGWRCQGGGRGDSYDNALAETINGLYSAKHHLIVDAAGVPLAVRTSPANLHDSKMFETMLDAIAPISDGRRGHPRRRPEKVHADRAGSGRMNTNQESISGSAAG
jgi:hypothetical protein